MTRNSFIATAVRVTVCILLIYLIVTRFNVRSIMQNIKLVDTSVFLLIFLSYSLANFFLFVRWFLIMKYMDMRVPFYTVAKAYLMGVFFNLFLPTSVGGDVFKAYHITKNSDGEKIEKTLFSVFFDRYVGLLVMLGAGSLFSIFLKAEIVGVQLSGVLFALLVILFLCSVVTLFYADRMDRIIEKVGFLRKYFAHTFKKISGILNVVERDKKLFLSIVACALCNLLMICLMHYIFISRIGKVDTFLPLLVFVPVVALLTMVPISLNGIGIREISYAALFETIGVNPSVSIAMSLLFYSIIVLFSLPGALYSLMMLVNKKELKI